MGMRAQEKSSGDIKIQPTEDGLHLDGSILWLDAKASGDLSFLSSSSSANVGTLGPQVIATEETIDILKANKKHVKALTCQYNRPFAIGKLKMELLPSGYGLGGASLYIETDHKRLLYAPHLQTQKTPTARQMQLKKAQTLILGATAHPDPNIHMPNRKKEKDRLLRTIRRLIKDEIYPIVLCQVTPMAQEITRLLSENDIPVLVHPAIYRINKTYEAHDFDLGNYGLWTHKSRAPAVKLLPTHTQGKSKLRSPLPDGPILLIEDSLLETNDPEVFRAIEDRFYIASTCDSKEYREIIAAVAPKEVFFFGPYAKRYVDEFKNCAPRVEPLYTNSQPTLF